MRGNRNSLALGAVERIVEFILFMLVVSSVFVFVAIAFLGVSAAQQLSWRAQASWQTPNTFCERMLFTFRINICNSTNHGRLVREPTQSLGVEVAAHTSNFL